MRSPKSHIVPACMQSPSWRVKLRAYDAFSQHIGPDKPQGCPHDHRTTQQLLRHALDCLAPAPGVSTAAELRRAALSAVATVHSYRPSDVVHAVHARVGPGSGQTDLMRVRTTFWTFLRVLCPGMHLRQPPNRHVSVGAPCSQSIQGSDSASTP